MSSRLASSSLVCVCLQRQRPSTFRCGIAESKGKAGPRSPRGMRPGAVPHATGIPVARHHGAEVVPNKTSESHPLQRKGCASRPLPLPLALALPRHPFAMLPNLSELALAPSPTGVVVNPDGSATLTPEEWATLARLTGEPSAPAPAPAPTHRGAPRRPVRYDDNSSSEDERPLAARAALAALAALALMWGSLRREWTKWLRAALRTHLM